VIYLDHNATTPIKPQVMAAVMAAMEHVGNASSVHTAGRQARAAVETARAQVASLCQTSPKNVIFTSGATESHNTIIKHYAHHTVLISSIEHPSVYESAPHADKIPTHSSGLINLEAYAQSLTKKPALVSCMLVNNETGVIQPIKQMAAMAYEAGAKFHCDAVQAAGRIPLDINELGVDYLTLSAHKMGGPQGVGAIITRTGTPPFKLIHGGGQERSVRAGTENTAGIIGFGIAANLAASDMQNYQRLKVLRDLIETNIEGITVFGADCPRVANTICFALNGVPADTQLMALDLAGICVSSGSACSSGTVKTSHVLSAMGIDAAIAQCALRISLGWNTTETEVQTFIETFKQLQKKWQK
jgi:cysteine desulfurase